MPTRTPITPVQLQDRLAAQRPPRVLDVRTGSEFETEHIPGSYNVPLHELKEHVEDLRDHLDREVVLVCRSGARATEAEQALARAGVENMHVLDGGIQGWTAVGGETRTGEPRWELERQVRLVAGSLVLTGVLTSVVFPPARWVAGAIGAGLTGAALTDSCLMAKGLARLPYNRASRGCDLDAALADMR